MILVNLHGRLPHISYHEQCRLSCDLMYNIKMCKMQYLVSMLNHLCILVFLSLQVASRRDPFSYHSPSSPHF